MYCAIIIILYVFNGCKFLFKVMDHDDALEEDEEDGVDSSIYENQTQDTLNDQVFIAK